MASKSIRLRQLQENESFSSFESWKGTVEYVFELDENFSEFFEEKFEWKSKDFPNRGLKDIKLEGRITKTAAQRAKYLNICLGQIACYATVISRDTIVRDSCSMKEIFHHLRTYYGFGKSGSSILDVVNIKRKGDESTEALYQRILTLVDSTLLTSDCDLTHHGQTFDEFRSPTIENLVICLWLKALNPSLPALVKQRYATQLKECTLGSIREEISACMPELLAELGEKESHPGAFHTNSYHTGIQPHRYPSQPRFQNRFPNPRYQVPHGYNPRNFRQPYSYSGTQNNNPSCPICKQAGRKKI